MGKKDIQDHPAYLRFEEEHRDLSRMLAARTVNREPGSLVMAPHPTHERHELAMVFEQHKSTREVTVIFLGGRMRLRLPVGETRFFFPESIHNRGNLISVIDLIRDLADPYALSRERPGLARALWKAGSAYSLLMAYHVDDGVI